MGAIKRKRKDENENQNTEKVLAAEQQIVADIATENHQPRKEQRVASSWLGNFLSQKRDLLVPVPPDHELADDIYLREFNLQFLRSSDRDNTDSDEDYGNSSIGKVEVEIIPGTVVIGADEIDEAPVAITSVKIKLYNLPYSMDEVKITAMGLKHGIEFLSVEVDVDKRNLPAGSASVVLALGVCGEEAVESLQGKDCNGRPLRVQLIIPKKSTGRLSGGRNDRYFLGGENTYDMKCNNCGKVGHKSSDCDSGLSNPCHLCAGKDHDAGDCPNITCFRCGEFGHHSRMCNNARRYNRAFICTLCSSSSHDSKHCMQLPEKAILKIEDKLIRCMRCNLLGHALCDSKKKKNKSKNNEIIGKKKTKDIYCPNCGEGDHHVDFSKPSKNRANSIIAPLNPCQAPKYDAYVKFPVLLRNINIVVGEKEEKVRYFQSLVRSAGNSELIQSWFPILCRNNMRNSVEEQEQRRNTIGYVRDNSRNGSNFISNSYHNTNSSDTRRESYSVSTSSSSSGGNNNDYQNNRNNRSMVNFDDEDHINDNRVSTNFPESKRRHSSNNGHNSVHNDSQATQIVNKTIFKHDHFSGHGRAYCYEEPETNKNNKWTGRRTVDNSQSTSHRTVFNGSGSGSFSQFRRSSNGSYDSSVINNSSKDRDNGRITRRY